MTVIYWFEDDYMFRPCLAIFRSYAPLQLTSGWLTPHPGRFNPGKSPRAHQKGLGEPYGQSERNLVKKARKASADRNPNPSGHSEYSFNGGSI